MDGLMSHHLEQVQHWKVPERALMDLAFGSVRVAQSVAPTAEALMARQLAARTKASQHSPSMPEHTMCRHLGAPLSPHGVLQAAAPS